MATDEVVIVPPQISEAKSKKLEEWLKAKVIRTTIGESVLIGALACANSKGVILPHYTRREEIDAIKSCSDMNTAVMETRRTAYGNLVLANDYGALIDPRIGERDAKRVSDTLDVEVFRGEIAGQPFVGSLAIATNKGVLAHPLLKDEERTLLENALRVPIDVGTINCGIPYVATGIIGNGFGAIAGSTTTGPELFMIGHALDVVRD